MKIKELSLEDRMLRIVFDVGDGTTIKHRTTVYEWMTPVQICDAIMEAERVATRMVSQRKSPEPPKLPEALRKMLDTTDSVYDDPEYTVGPGPITPHALLEAGD